MSRRAARGNTQFRQSSGGLGTRKILVAADREERVGPPVLRGPRAGVERTGAQGPAA